MWRELLYDKVIDVENIGGVANSLVVYVITLWTTLWDNPTFRAALPYRICARTWQYWFCMYACMLRYSAGCCRLSCQTGFPLLFTVTTLHLLLRQLRPLDCVSLLTFVSRALNTIIQNSLARDRQAWLSRKRVFASCLRPFISFNRGDLFGTRHHA